MNKKTNKYLAANVILLEEPHAGPLLLGDCNSAVDLAILKPHKVRTIISIGLQAKPAENKIPEEISHHVYDIHDNKQQKLPVQLLDEVCGIIEKGRQKGGVLVHCYAGVSRSSSFVIAYMINKHFLSYEEAKEKAKKRRPCVHPGDGFVRQLQHYSKVVIAREQQRLADLQKVEQKQEIIQPTLQSLSMMTQRTKRGVRGAVKSAQFIPQELKSSLLNKSLVESQRNFEEKPDQKRQGSIGVRQKVQESPDRLPPISQRYKPCSSQGQIRQVIDKIEGRQMGKKGPSFQKIYGHKPKVM